MKKTLTISCLLFLFGINSATSQTNNFSLSNHNLMKLGIKGAITAPMSSSIPDPFLPSMMRGRQEAAQVNANTVAVEIAQATASTAIPKLGNMDADGNITAPISNSGQILSSYAAPYGSSVIGTSALDTASVPLGDMANIGRSSFTSMIDSATIMKVSATHRQANPASDDVWLDPDGINIGGFLYGRGSHVVQTCQDEGGMNLGACLSVWNSSAGSWGNRPGISPVYGADTATYGTALDSVVIDNGTTNSTPKLVLSSNLKSWYGTAHSVYFTSSGVYVYPALSSVESGRIKQHQTLMTNVSTPAMVNRFGSGIYQRYDPNGFSGMLQNWWLSTPCDSNFTAAGGSSGTCTLLFVDTWAIPGSTITGANPQKYATTSSNLDTHYDSYATVPTVYVGARTKMFNDLYTCRLDDADTSGESDASAGVFSKHSLMRECENAEYDNELISSVSGKYHFNGLTIALGSSVKGTTWADGTTQTDGLTAWPEMSSWGIYLGGQFPRLLELNPIVSSIPWALFGNTIGVTSPVSSGTASGNIAIAMTLKKQAGDSSMREDHWEQCDATGTNTCTSYGNRSWNIGLRIGAPDQDSLSTTVFNSTSRLSGYAGAHVSFGGDGTFHVFDAAGNSLLETTSDKRILLQANTTLPGGGGFLFQSPNTDSYLYAVEDNTGFLNLTPSGATASSGGVKTTNIITTGTLTANGTFVSDAAAYFHGDVTIQNNSNFIMAYGASGTTYARIHLDNNGNFLVDGSGAGGMDATGGIGSGARALANMGTGSFDGEQRWCSDCTLNSMTGVQGYWHATAAKWTDSQNNRLR